MSDMTSQLGVRSFEKIDLYARYGEWAVKLALALLAILVGYVIFTLVTAPASLGLEVKEILSLEDVAAPLTGAQTLLGMVFATLPDLLGVVLLLVSHRLFVDLRTVGVFTAQTARHLRRIGVIILAFAPVSILTQLVGNFLLTLWITGDRVSISIGIEDADVYAIVLGFVITAVSHIMVEAVRISDEHRSFV